MISVSNGRSVSIKITTYIKPSDLIGKAKMDDRSPKKCQKSQKYVCSLCLNNRVEGKGSECCRRIPKSCPICQKTKESALNEVKKEKDVRDKGVDMKEVPNKDPNVKTVQTSDTNVAQGLSLLNEVLTVFQNKKVDMNKEKVKSGLLKDVAVATDDQNDDKNLKDRARLTVSTFQYSIEDSKRCHENGKFIIVNSSQPEVVGCRNSVDLIKHKSSSIPQMKLEELKYSLKAKSRSKDAIEEVNRLFATVRKPSQKISDASNRPMVRNGPRVLPVVNNNYSLYAEPNKRDLGFECVNPHNSSCKVCQTCMSSGDSNTKNECCHPDKQRCDKCVYMLCCHYEKQRKVQTGVLICEHCREMNEEYCCQHDCIEDSGYN
ncbi:uncharacterized protein LOC118279800 [Spodoptera frugiperda]|uniref:Uncharacterized protein LOC118279800 n=1 Tax=Spodoptera frugiperda TaxID=7108 RepID=A0A9R0DIP4_SPOFR|nr:uncharacterized protein LOC118279800 [Spodoptera frugiperda]